MVGPEEPTERAHCISKPMAKQTDDGLIPAEPQLSYTRQPMVIPDLIQSSRQTEKHCRKKKTSNKSIAVKFPKIRYADADADHVSSAFINSSSPNTSTVFFHTRSVMRSNVTSWFIRWRTHATPPIAHGSFLPLTAFPWTNFSGLVSGGKYSDRSD